MFDGIFDYLTGLTGANISQFLWGLFHFLDVELKNFLLKIIQPKTKGRQIFRIIKLLSD